MVLEHRRNKNPISDKKKAPGRISSGGYVCYMRNTANVL